MLKLYAQILQPISNIGFSVLLTPNHAPIIICVASLRSFFVKVVSSPSEASLGCVSNTQGFLQHHGGP